jgi:solute carrier family 9 (sodium/hydrogen exchanger), member 10/11
LFYEHEFTFEESLLFGSLISAIDPVAVVSLLKELGVSRTLSTLIEGVSLINDGTAFVMFTITLDLAKGAEFHIGEVILNSIRLSIGGPIWGLF